MKSWFKSRLTLKKSQSSEGDRTLKKSQSGEETKQKEPFVGGAVLKKRESNSTASGSAKVAKNDTPKVEATSEEKVGAATPPREVSPMSTDDEGSTGPAGGATEKDTAVPPITPPNPIEDPMKKRTDSPGRDSRFRENIE